MKPNMARFLLIPAAALSLIAAQTIGAIDWPTAVGELTSSFGQNDHGRPTVGLQFDGDDAVRAADAGEILFAASGGSFAGQLDELPYTLGEWVAIDHGNGIMSVYGRMEPNEEQSGQKSVVEKGAVLGHSGTSGWSDGTGFYFSVFDRQERRWVNPTMIAGARADSRPPVVKAVTLATREGQSIPLAANRLLRQGSYRVIVEAYDTENSRKQSPLAPQRLVCMVNGAEQGSLHLETMKTVGGELTVSRIKPSPASAVYQNAGGFDLGEIKLTRGRTTIEIIARDSSGNERIASFAVVVE